MRRSSRRSTVRSVSPSSLPSWTVSVNSPSSALIETCGRYRIAHRRALTLVGGHWLGRR
jgi:hypothetical protein